MSTAHQIIANRKHFLELPAEVRQHTYVLLFSAIVIQVHNPATTPARTSTIDNSSLAILLTNKTIYNEAYPVFLHNTLFVIDIECDRHNECNALDHLRDGRLLSEMGRLWVHADSSAEIIAERARLQTLYGSTGRLEEIRVSYNKRTIIDLLNSTLGLRQRINRTRMAEFKGGGRMVSEDGEVVKATWSVMQLHATPFSYPGQSFRKGLYRHECEKLVLTGKDVCISTRCLSFDQRAAFERKLHKAFALTGGPRIVYENVICSACASPSDLTFANHHSSPASDVILQ